MIIMSQLGFLVKQSAKLAKKKVDIVFTEILKLFNVKKLLLTCLATFVQFFAQDDEQMKMSDS